MAGHTKGPWTVRRSRHSCGGRPYQIMAGNHRRITTWGGIASPADPESESNARLIASAPDLLEAIQPLAPADDATAEHFASMDPDDTVTITVPVRCILKARAAINRARTGEGG